MTQFIDFMNTKTANPMLRILIVDDAASVGAVLKKFASRFKIDIKIDIIYWKHQNRLRPHITRSLDYLEFKSEKITDSVLEIESLKEKYDIFLCYNWRAALVCYLAGVNYIFHGVGTDIRTIDTPMSRREYVEHFFYKLALRNASFVVVASKDLMTIARKYNDRTKYIKIIHDGYLFTHDGQKIDRTEIHILGNEYAVDLDHKFIFLSPTRMDWIKGFDILWNAIDRAKSDFVVLQCDWGTEPDYTQIKNSMPDKVKLIPLIKRDETPLYYRSVDAVFGNFKVGTMGLIEREAVLCKCAVLTYAPLTHHDVEDPFLSKNDPEYLAKMIDKLVLDKEFKKELLARQYSFISEYYSLDNTISTWQKVFNEAMQMRHKRPRGFLKTIIRLIESQVKITNVRS